MARRSKQTEDKFSDARNRKHGVCMGASCLHCAGSGYRKNGTVCGHVIGCRCDECKGKQ